MRICLDTNILLYAFGLGFAPADVPKIELCRTLIEEIAQSDRVVPVQVLGEFYAVVTGKGRRSASVARAAIKWLTMGADLASTTSSAFEGALELNAQHQLSFWDAAILSVAAENGCRYLLSEDMHEGFEWRGTKVLNPMSARGRLLFSLGR